MSVSVATTAKVVMTTKDHWKEIWIGLSVFIFSIVVIAASITLDSPNPTGTAKVPKQVAQWRPLVTEYAEKYGVEKYVDFLLALIAQESGGRGGDIMQSSESMGLPPNTIQDPAQSVDAGVKYFKSMLKQMKKYHVDFNTLVQSYNFGGGYMIFVSKHGGKSTVALAQEFSSMQAKKHGWSSYGDTNYVAHVMRYMNSASQVNGDNSPLGKKKFDNLLQVVLKFENQPYVWGGSNPSTGFDCSGLTSYAYSQIGINLPRTAQAQYSSVKKVSDPKPGDLIFFSGTYSGGPKITHVGIYIDSNTMYDANDGGVGYHHLKGYWTNHLAGYGRP